MSGTFMGTYENSITNRRASIPSHFRKLISPAAKMQLIAVRGRLNTIYIFPLDNWKDLEEKLENGTNKQRKLLRRFRFYATPLTIEGPGRILIPQKLLDIASIIDKVIFIGEGKYFSIWNTKNYRKYESEIEKLYDKTIKNNQDLL
ncbi:MAG: hypothetical protein H8D22_05805 [Candidatus Cloacimonetes bacterium]|nr:hypothetical protein [Candidatus Cloacimonadota bacterium]